MNSALSTQIKFFDSNKDKLLKQYPEMILVISADLKVTAFRTLEKGFKFGVAKYGYGQFLLKDCKQESLNAVHKVSPIIQAL